MKTLVDWSRGLRRPIACSVAMLVIAGAHAESSCPALVETHSGSVFNLAALIHDRGSPAAALDDARLAVTRVNAGGGCRIFKEPAACDETVALAKIAIAALEACTGAKSQDGSVRKDDF
jgi:hypothetical protein